MNKHVIIASHRRSGTHLTLDAIVNNFAAFADNPHVNNVTLDDLCERNGPKLTLNNVAATVARKSCVLKTHSHSDIARFFSDSEQLSEFAVGLFASSKIIYIHRDGRDVLTSLYFYARRSSEQVKNSTFAQFLRSTNTFDDTTYDGELSRTAYWDLHVRSWLARDGVLLLSFSDFHSNYEQTLQAISSFLGEPLNKRRVDVRMNNRPAAWHLLQRLKKKLLPPRHQGVRRSFVVFRKGSQGDWRTKFDERDVSYFNKTAGGSNLLLGYQQ